jgi:hydrogenase-4 component H
MIFSWVRRGLRTGVLTTRYPAVPEQMPPGFRGRPILDADCCQSGEGCDACVHVCLPNALRLTKGTVANGNTPGNSGEPEITLDYARCIMCGLCVDACPAGALRMTEDYELAVTDLNDLCNVTVFLPTTESKNGNSEKERNNGRTA